MGAAGRPSLLFDFRCLSFDYGRESLMFRGNFSLLKNCCFTITYAASSDDADKCPYKRFLFFYFLFICLFFFSVILFCFVFHFLNVFSRFNVVRQRGGVKARTLTGRVDRH